MKSKLHLVFRIVCLLSFIFFVSSCGTLHYRTDQKVPISFSPGFKGDQYFEIKTDYSFYLFGRIPKENNVYIDQILFNHRINAARNLKIEEYTHNWGGLLTIISLGFYSVRTVKITGLHSY